MDKSKYKRKPKRPSISYTDWWLIFIINPCLRFTSEWAGVAFIILCIIFAALIIREWHSVFDLKQFISVELKQFIPLFISVLSYLGVAKNKIKYAEIRIELSKQFNLKYDNMNNSLRYYMKIVQDGKPTDEKGIKIYNCADNKVYDYFNLCSEEYYYYVKGLIDQRTWNTWFDGIQDILKDYSSVSQLWLNDFKLNDYYGSYFLFRKCLTAKKL